MGHQLKFTADHGSKKMRVQVLLKLHEENCFCIIILKRKILGFIFESFQIKRYRKKKFVSNLIKTFENCRIAKVISIT